MPLTDEAPPTPQGEPEDEDLSDEDLASDEEPDEEESDAVLPPDPEG